MNKKLKRSTKNKMLLGVCSGIAEYFNIDPNFIRVLWVALACACGTGILAYLISAIIIPKNTDNI